MAELDIRTATTTDMANIVTDYSVSAGYLDSVGDIEENTWTNPKFSEYLGYYKTIPELKQAIDSLATWTIGKGWDCDNRTKIILRNINGWREDSFHSIMENMLIIKKINGDSFAEVIRSEKGTLINLKPLAPDRIKIVVGKDGIIKRYEQLDRFRKQTQKLIDVENMFHLSNNRIGDEIHGVSVVESCKWVIDARNEAMTDWRKILHRNLAGVRIIEVDEDDVSKIAILKRQWSDAIKNGEVLIVPRGVMTDKGIPPVNPENWIRYLENFFYQAVGVPKIILGGSQEFTEASSKIGYLTFEQVYITEQKLLEQDLFNQLGIQLEFKKPVSLKENIVASEEKNTGQVGFQPNEITPTIGRNE